jgi:hypothetical protein
VLFCENCGDDCFAKNDDEDAVVVEREEELRGGEASPFK